MDRYEVMDKAIKYWGVEAQMNMLIEEAAEYIAAATEYRRGMAVIDEYIDETADLQIMLDQAKRICITDDETRRIYTDAADASPPMADAVVEAALLIQCLQKVKRGKLGVANVLDHLGTTQAALNRAIVNDIAPMGRLADLDTRIDYKIARTAAKLKQRGGI